MSSDSQARRIPTWVWVLLGISVCLVLFVAVPIYETDDDPAMVGLLSGRGYGRPFDAVFLGHTLSALLTHCYAAAPAVPWYGLFMESVGVLSAALWVALIAGRLRRPVQVLTALAAFFTAHQYILLRVNFAGVALSLFLVAAAWFIKLQVERRPFRWWQFWPGAAMGFAHMIRPTLSHVLLFFAFPCLVVSIGRGRRARAFAVMAAAACMVVWTGSSRRAWEAIPENRDYTEFTGLRGAFVDRPHVCTQAALDAAGWSHTDYHLAKALWLHDEQVFSAESFRRYLAKATPAGGLAHRFAVARSFFIKPYHLFCLAVLLACAIYLWLDRACRGDHPWPVVPPIVRAFAWSWLGMGWVALLCNRLPPRVYVPLYVYFGVLTLWMPFPLPDAVRKHGVPRWTRVPVLLVILGLALFAATFRAKGAQVARERDRGLERDFLAAARGLSTEALYVPLSPLWSAASRSVFASRSSGPGARILSAGWVIRSPAYYHLLGQFGYESGHALLEEAAHDPRVVFVVSREYGGRLGHVADYLNHHMASHGPVHFEPVDTGPSGAFLCYRLKQTEHRLIRRTP